MLICLPNCLCYVTGYLYHSIWYSRSYHWIWCSPSYHWTCGIAPATNSIVKLESRFAQSVRCFSCGFILGLLIDRLKGTFVGVSLVPGERRFSGGSIVTRAYSDQTWATQHFLISLPNPSPPKKRRGKETTIQLPRLNQLLSDADEIACLQIKKTLQIWNAKRDLFFIFVFFFLFISIHIRRFSRIFCRLGNDLLHSKIKAKHDKWFMSPEVDRGLLFKAKNWITFTPDFRQFSDFLWREVGRG